MQLVLREVTVDDLDVLFAHQTDPVAVAMASPVRRTREQFFEHWTKKVIGAPKHRNRAILIDGQLAGFVVAFDRAAMRELAHLLGRECWGRGIASRAVAEFLREEKNRPLHATVAVTNAG